MLVMAFALPSLSFAFLRPFVCFPVRSFSRCLSFILSLFPARPSPPPPPFSCYPPSFPLPPYSVPPPSLISSLPPSPPPSLLRPSLPPSHQDLNSKGIEPGGRVFNEDDDKKADVPLPPSLSFRVIRFVSPISVPLPAPLCLSVRPLPSRPPPVYLAVLFVLPVWLFVLCRLCLCPPSFAPKVL
jgi:hypothetical protein